MSFRSQLDRYIAGARRTSTSELLYDNFFTIPKRTSATPFSQLLPFPVATLAGDVLLLELYLDAPTGGEVVVAIDTLAGSGYQDARTFVLLSGGPAGQQQRVPIVVPLLGHHFVNVLIANPSAIDDADVDVRAYAITSPVPPAEMLPAVRAGTRGLAGAAIGAGATAELDAWSNTGYSRLYVAGHCTQAWAIDAEWITDGRDTTGGANTFRTATWTETLAAGAAGPIAVDIPLRASGVRLKARNTSAAAGVITASSRILR